MTYSLHEAKAKLSKLVSLAETGETIEITRHGKVVAHLTGASGEPRPFGTGKGSFTPTGPWDLTEYEIDDFYHGGIEP